MTTVTATKRSSNRSRQILEQATRLFSSRGYDGASIRLIARSCGITEAAIYRHYHNKAHLYEEVIREKARQHDIRSYLESLRGSGGVEDVLTKVARHILALADKDPELMRLMHFNSLESARSLSKRPCV